MTNFIDKPINTGGLTANRIFLSHRTIQIRLGLEDGQEEVILNHWNVFYLTNSASNLVSLSLLNDLNIFYDNMYHTLYNKIY